MHTDEQEGVDRNVKMKEKWVAATLSPVEPMVMNLQSLLVWENPLKSALLFTIVHVSFWFLAYISTRFYFLISASVLILFFVNTWKKKIWPEIRVPPLVPEDDEDWISVHPRLLSTPEISRHIAQALHLIQTTLRRWRLFRRSNPPKFSFFACSFFVTLYLVSRCVSGLTLTYTIVMSVLLWPCVMYHDLLKKGYLYMEPVFMWLDYQLKHLKVGKVEGQEKKEPAPMTDKPTAIITDIEEEFCPSYDPETTAALARAITDSEDEGGTPSIPTPGLSKEPSIDSSDDECDINDDLMPSIDQMPSFDDLDHTDDEWSPGSPNDRTGNISFTPQHFGDETDSEDEDRIGEIGIPDEYDNSITHALVSQTLTNMMENALQGLIPNEESSSFSPGSGAKITYTKTSQGESFDISEAADDTIIEEEEEEESADAENIEKEFDFLDDYEEDDSKKK